ncbi:MAG: hypothetical protein BMS9Abin07_1343 [Acidimicrobiia bacterium]|nr:MAG: hypothetical protein BMS9Abin07_1343 [Acidimicrobiia bacterium]
MNAPTAYSPARLDPSIDLDLSKNEGRPPNEPLLSAVLNEATVVGRYPDLAPLRRRIAAELGVEPDRVLVTAGGDDALFRCFLARVGPGRRAVATTPSFEMISRYAEQVGGGLTEIDWWNGPYPVHSVVSALGERDVLFVVSPNNPTGAVITESDLRLLSERAALVVLDTAYIEFADDDLTGAALQLDNVVIIRTLSKAWGLAGLRVGYLLGPPDLVAEIGAYGSPYPVSGLSASLATTRLDAGDQMTAFVEDVKRERTALVEILETRSIEAYPSQANFVLARFDEADWVASAAAALGVGLRRFPGRGPLEDHLRMTLPGDDRRFKRLVHALLSALDPQALLFDLDGVLCDVSASQTKAIVQTAAGFGVEVTASDVQRAKAAGNASDDWELTRRLCAEADVEAAAGEIEDRFESLYQGSDGRNGLKDNESLLVERSLLSRWAGRLPLGVVTGRPRTDAEEFLRRFGLEELMSVVVTRDDAPLKPDPGPVRLALSRLGVERAWMFGDTPDDIAASRKAAVVPVGVIAPGDDPAMAKEALAGSARIVSELRALEGLLP